LDTKESILSMELEATDQQSGQKGSLAITNDMWLAPEIPGYSEVRDFNERYARKMGMIFGDIFKPSMAAMQPGSAEGMAEMVKEMSNLKGVPVMQVMRMGATANGEPLPAASEAPLPASNGPAMPSAGDVAKQSATLVKRRKIPRRTSRRRTDRNPARLPRPHRACSWSRARNCPASRRPQSIHLCSMCRLDMCRLLRTPNHLLIEKCLINCCGCRAVLVRTLVTRHRRYL
jgi:hypothetical protein